MHSKKQTSSYSGSENKGAIKRILSEESVHFCFVGTALVLSSVLFVHKLVLVVFINVHLSELVRNRTFGHVGTVNTAPCRTEEPGGGCRRQQSLPGSLPGSLPRAPPAGDAGHVLTGATCRPGREAQLTNKCTSKSDNCALTRFIQSALTKRLHVFNPLIFSLCK